MQSGWEGSETNRFINDTIYEKEKYYTKEAKPYKIKKVYFTFLAEDEEGNEREFKEYEITTETKETVILHLRQFGHEVVEYPNYIILNPKTDNEVIDVLHFKNHFLFNEGDEQHIGFALRIATQIVDELARFRAWVAEEDAIENGDYEEEDDDDEDYDDDDIEDTENGTPPENKMQENTQNHKRTAKRKDEK